MRPDGKFRGFIAQAVEKAIPSAVLHTALHSDATGDLGPFDDGIHLLDLGPLTMEAVGAIQVLDQRASCMTGIFGCHSCINSFSPLDSLQEIAKILDAVKVEVGNIKQLVADAGRGL